MILEAGALGFDGCCGEMHDPKVCDWPENGVIPEENIGDDEAALLCLFSPKIPHFS